jgi:hypothetical protein
VRKNKSDDDVPPDRGTRERESWHSEKRSNEAHESSLELIFVFYGLFGCGMRQITGHMLEFQALCGLASWYPASGF